MSPGRIVCDSTWHHFVNVNIDGAGSGRSGLGTGSGDSWVPSADCEKIFRYYRNIVSWLQPQKELMPALLRDLVMLRFHPLLVEELIEAPQFGEAAQFESLGMAALELIDAARGTGTGADMVHAALRLDKSTARIAESGEAGLFRQDPSAIDPVVAYSLGRAVAHVAGLLPTGQTEELRRTFQGKRRVRHERQVGRVMAETAREAVAVQIEQAKGRLDRLSALNAYPTARQLSDQAAELASAIIVEQAG